jgi:hypothetical protein
MCWPLGAALTAIAPHGNTPWQRPGQDAPAPPARIQTRTVRKPIPACYNKPMKHKHNTWFEPLVAILAAILEAIIGSLL